MFSAPTWLLQLGIAIVILTFFLWKYIVRNFDYWKKRGVYYVEPAPVVGNLWDVACLKKSALDWIIDLYFSTNEKLVGIFLFNDPVLMVKDPKIIQLIMVKHTDIFMNRSNAEPLHDKVMKYFTFLQKGSEWKSDRAKLTPVFTPAKLKGMFHLINNMGEEMVEYFNKQLGQIDAKDISSRYTTNVIAKCAFGINAYCFDEKDSEFRNYTQRLFQFSLRNAVAQMSYFLKPSMVERFKIDIFEGNTRDFFCRVFTESMASRRKNNDKVNDFLDLIIDLKSTENLPEESAMHKACGQAIMFFAAGFETTSTVISFTLHELCLNEDIQHRVRAEIHEKIKKHGGITYEAVQEMKYLKSCVSESLRKYPVVAFLSRECNAAFKVPETDLVIEKGVPVFIPIAGLQMDEKYFPDPQRYNPDRFMEKNVNENGLVYMPFGDGPRKCIESLRKYPVVAFLSRECNAAFKVPETDLVIEKGVPVFIPIAGLQMDEKYFPDPQRYNPDRFMEKNVNENGLVYMPFGDGPRKCIGDRFGLLSSHVGLIHILLNYEVERCAATPDPVVFEPKSIANMSKVGLPMRLKRITSTRDA